MPTEFLTVQVLQSLGGQVLAIGLITQLCRFLPFVTGPVTQCVAVACGIALQATFAWHGFTAPGLLLNLLNGIITALTAMKGAEVMGGRVTISRETAKRAGVA